MQSGRSEGERLLHDYIWHSEGGRHCVEFRSAAAIRCAWQGCCRECGNSTLCYELHLGFEFQCCPGWVATDMSSYKGPLTIEQGAETPVWLATLPHEENIPRGRLCYDMDVGDFVNGKV